MNKVKTYMIGSKSNQCSLKEGLTEEQAIKYWKNKISGTVAIFDEYIECEQNIGCPANIIFDGGLKKAYIEVENNPGY